MRAIVLGGIAAMALAGAARADPDPTALAYKLPAQIVWQGDPVKGPQSYVLWGDPTKPGPYAILARWPPHQMSRPHTHPFDRRITVISGMNENSTW